MRAPTNKESLPVVLFLQVLVAFPISTQIGLRERIPSSDTVPPLSVDVKRRMDRRVTPSTVMVRPLRRVLILEAGTLRQVVVLTASPTGIVSGDISLLRRLRDVRGFATVGMGVRLCMPVCGRLLRCVTMFLGIPEVPP